MHCLHEPAGAVCGHVQRDDLNVSDPKDRAQVHVGDRHSVERRVDHSFRVITPDEIVGVLGCVYLLKLISVDSRRYLVYVDDRIVFLLLSLLLRVLESLGATGAMVAAFSLTAVSFPESVASTFVSVILRPPVVVRIEIARYRY